MNEDLRKWVEDATDEQFWSYQYVEHLQMIIESLEESGLDASRARSLEVSWLSRHQKLMDMSNDIPFNELVELKAFKTVILKQIVDAPNWLGPTFPSVIDHMIREVEFMEHERTPRRIIALWLTDMCGHAAIDEATIDPAHKKLRKKAKSFILAFEDIKKLLGQKEELGLEELMTRVDQSMITDWIDREVPLDTDILETATRMLEVQKALTQYHVESFKLFQEGKLLTIMKPKLMVHTIRESYRAECDLEAILE